ncbi:MAG TPA: diacylglycerol kinase family protein, partial [Thermoleophilaceae bacterium]|nr:diacylglycerol kinase family protein [Thermoleophilaceae bacterium]
MPGSLKPPSDEGLVAVVNGSASGAGDPHALLEVVCAELRAAGARAEGVVTGSEQELGEVLAGAEGRRVALVGGDGTLHAAVNQPVEL